MPLQERELDLSLGASEVYLNKKNKVIMKSMDTGLLWRKPEYSNLIAWSSAEGDKTYAEVLQDMASITTSSDFCILEDQGPYLNMLQYMAAWELQRPVCLIPKSWPENWKEHVRARVRSQEERISEEIFYILPTSGSTGIPKLVIITRRNWAAFLKSLLPLYRWEPGTRVALAFEGVFDPFVAMLFLTFSQGGSLWPLESSDKFDIFAFIQQKRIDVWASVPSLVGLNGGRTQVKSLAGLKQALFTGEKLSPALLRRWFEVAPKAKVENLYGPVETTVWVTRYECRRDQEYSTVPIGRPLSASIETEIIDGELHILGAQVAEGYLTEQGIQAFQGSYATGDLVEEREGLLHWIGRKDLQVKYQGQRVELEAIENSFLTFTGSIAICGLQETGLYLVMEETQRHSLAEIFRYLKNHLPASHRPRVFYEIKAWPYSPSGKLDRKNVVDNLSTCRRLSLGESQL